MTANIRGDIVEFGVGRGRSLLILCYLLSQMRSKKKLYAFDSFNGFGKIHIKDKSWRNPKTGDWSRSPDKRYQYNVSFLKKILNIHLHKRNRYPIKFVKGYIENKLPKYKKLNKISFIHCDVDLYVPHKVILENIWEKLSKNGIILFDDIDIDKGVLTEKFPGPVASFKEFFKGKKIKIHTLKDRKNIFVKKI